MLTAEEVRKDLENICAQTDSHWLAFDYIHTKDSQKDADLYLKEMKRLGYTRGMLLGSGNLELSYGGGTEIKHQEELYFSGYTMNGYKKNKNRLVILYGFDTDNDKHTVYHECAHLFQFKFNTFGIRFRNDYSTYLSEVHANTFSSMVLFLKSRNILEYKKCRLGRFADGIEKVLDKRPEILYYMSLPIELQLMKEIRKNGRLNTLNSFQKNGALDFKKIFFYTKKLVEKYAYSEKEFEQIKNDTPPEKHLFLQRKAKAYRLLGKAYWHHEYLKYRKKSNRHTKIEMDRIQARLKKIERLPQKTARAEIINEVCKLDCYQVEMTSKHGIFNSLNLLDKGAQSFESTNSLDTKSASFKDMIKTFEKMCGIYQKYKDNILFQLLFQRLKTIDGRDTVWAFKEKERLKLSQLKLLNTTKQNIK